MIIQLPLIVSLLLFTVVHSADIEYKIDHKRCGGDTACFIRESCFDGHENDDAAKSSLVDYPDPADKKMKDEECDVIMQIKPYHKKKFLVMMQLISTAGTLDKSASFGIHQKDDEQMVCKGGESIPTGNSEFTFEYDGKKPNPNVEATKMFCSFFVTSKSKKIVDIFDENEFSGLFPEFKYTDSDSTVKTVLKYNEAKDKFWSKPINFMKCENYLETFVSDDGINEDVDTSKKSIVCSDGYEFAVKHDGIVKDTKLFKCNAAGQLSFDVDGSEITVTQKLEVACRKRFCNACGDPPTSACAGEECKPPTPDVDDKGCSVLTCPGDKYTMDGKDILTSTKKVTCEKKDETTAVWRIHDTDPPKEITPGLSCLAKKKCSASFTVKCPPTSTCSNVEPIVSEEKITCTDGKLNSIRNEIKCNTNTGLWDDINDAKEIFCESSKSATADEKVATGGGPDTGLVIGCVVGALVLLGLVGGAVYYFKVRKVQQDKKKQPPSKGLSSKSKKSGAGKSTESKSKKGSTSDPPKESNKETDRAATPADGSTTPAATADPKQPVSTDIEKLADKASDPKNPPTATADNGTSPVPV